MPDWVLDLYDISAGAVFEKHLNRISDGAFFGIEIVFGIARIFADGHRGAEGVNAGVPGGFILVVVGGEVAGNEADSGHILEAMVAIRRVAEGTALVNDPNGRLVGGDDDFAHVGESWSDDWMKAHGGFDGGLGVEFGREGDFEQDIFHDVGTERTGEANRPALKEDVAE